MTTDAEYIGLTASQLAKIASSLKAENAKLRDAMYANAGIHGLQHMDADELRIWATQQAKLIDALRELVLKNWYIALSEREALRAHGIEPYGDAYMTVLDGEIAIAKDHMRELGIEVDE